MTDAAQPWGATGRELTYKDNRRETEKEVTEL